MSAPPTRSFQLIGLIASASCGRVAFDVRFDARMDGAPATSDASGIGIDGDAMPDVPVVGLVLWVPFDGAMLDERVTSEVGACPSCPQPTTRRAGTDAVTFDGVQDCVSFSDRPALRSSELTVAIFIAASSQAAMTIVTKPSDTVAGTSNSWEMTRANTTIGYPSFSGQYDPWETPASVPTGEWHHVAFTYSSGTKRVYLDGSEMGSLAAPAFVYGSDPLLVGCDVNNATRGPFFAGALDELRIYDRALDAGQIAVLSAQ